MYIELSISTGEINFIIRHIVTFD